MHSVNIFCALFLSLSASVYAVDLSNYPQIELSTEDSSLIWVDNSADETGTGNASSPFGSVTEAVAIASKDSVIVVRAGVYRERIRLKGEDAPQALLAYPGEHVVITGLEPIREWQELPNGIYQATISAEPHKFFIGNTPHSLARFPSDGWLKSETTTEDTLNNPALSTIEFPIENTQAYIWTQYGNNFHTAAIEEHNPDSSQIRILLPSKWVRLTDNDKFYLQNNRTFIREAGDWAWEHKGDDYLVYYHPSKPADLEQAQFSGNKESIIRIDRAENIAILGLDIIGSVGHGVHITTSADIRVQHCRFYDNGNHGIMMRGTQNGRINNNLTTFNGNTGIVIHGCTQGEVSENEVSYNGIDGVVVSWNSAEITIARNYVHHQLLWGHPDGMQIYRNVRNLRFLDNLILAVGQTLMCEEAEQVEFSGNICAGSGANMLICGHKNARDFTISKNTFLFPGYSAIAMSADNYQVTQNAFVVGHKGIAFAVNEETNYQGQKNLFWSGPGLDSNILRSWSSSSQDLAAFQTTTGQDTDSIYESPGFRNAPTLYDVIDHRKLSECTAERFFLRFKGENMEVGDVIEINFDGVSREITAVAEGSITVKPALQRQPVKGWLIVNWKDNCNFQLDLQPAKGSPLLDVDGDGKQFIGSSVNVANYQRGDFDGDGQRDCPDIPDFFESRLTEFR